MHEEKDKALAFQLLIGTGSQVDLNNGFSGREADSGA